MGKTLKEQLAGKTVNEVTHSPRRSGGDVLKRMRGLLGKAKVAAQPSATRKMTEEVTAIRSEVTPVMGDLGEQIGLILSADNFSDLLESLNEKRDIALQLVKQVPSACTVEVGLACLFNAWESSGKDSRALSNLTGLGESFGLFYEDEPGDFLPIYRDGQGVQSTTFRAKREALPLLKAMAEVQSNLHNARKSCFRNSIQKLKDKATCKNILEACQKGGLAWFEHHYKGQRGTVLVEVANGNIKPIETFGRAVWQAQKVADEGVSLPLEQLSAEKLQLQETYEKQLFGCILGFWYMVRKAVERAKHGAAAKAASEAFKSTATLTTEEFYNQNPETQKAGTFPVYRRNFKVTNRETGKVTYYNHVLWMMERFEDGKLAVVNTHGDDSAKLLQAFEVVKKPTPVSGLAYPLNILLFDARRGYEKTKAEAEAKAKADAKAKAETDAEERQAKADAEVEERRNRAAKTELAARGE